jgi:hypothetical protein
MPEETDRTFRALVDTIMPARDGRPGAAELGVHAHVAEALDLLIPGFSALAVMLLDAYAADIRPGALFAELAPTERDEVVRAMARERSQDLQELVGAILVFTVGAMFNERMSYDRTTGRLDPPATWAEVGFRGPSLGHPRYGPS